MAFTYFFRDLQSLQLITRHVLPVLRGCRYISIWDAGCAHGPEPYSIAIMLREKVSHFLFRNVHIYATDIDGSDQFGRIITEGVYPQCEIKRIPRAIRKKYFTETDTPGHYKIDDQIRAQVSYVRHDLLSLQPVRTGLSLIVCKNVLLHFSEDQRSAVIRMFHDALREVGFLVMEQTQKLPRRTGDLFRQVTAEGQIFRKVSSQSTAGVEEFEETKNLVC